MKSMNNRKRKVSLKMVLAIVVFSAIVLPFVASAFARAPQETEEGFMNPFDFTLSPFEAIEFGVADSLDGGSSDSGRGPAMSPAPAASSVRPILVPYRPRPRSPIWF